MSEREPIRIEKDEHVAWVILNRPEKRNAMSLDFFDGLVKHFTAFDGDPEVRVIVVRAEGESFTAGIDLMELAPLIQGEGAAFRESLRTQILKLQEGINRVERCRKPVIAAVHSHCIGGGVDLLSACDIRMASLDAVFAIRETRMAIIADLGTLQRLPHIIGHGRFRELALTGRDFLAEEAFRIGFITHLCKDRESLYQEAGNLAREIAQCSPLTVQGVKDVINYSRDHGVYPGLEYVAQKNATVLPSEDLMEALSAFIAKRPPVFKGN
jgi:enoyl-CoA hydratase